MPEAVICSAVRTPIGRAGKGSFVDVRPDDLLAFAIREAVGRVDGLDPGDVVDVMVGCGFPQEKQGMNLARRAALLAGLPKRVPGTTVNRFCASSLQTARMAFHAIKAGEGDVYVAAGVESISQVDGYPKDAEELHPKLVGEGAVANVYIPMGLTAENVAEQFDVSREDMDRFAQRSQERAVAAQESGFFAREIAPYTKEDGTVVSSDDGPRPSSTLEKLTELQPAFKPDGKVTAGNSCPLNDGAAALVIMSEEKAAELGVKPRARIIASSVTGLDPEIMGVGPIDAVKVALERAGMTIEDVDVMELNEAFAAQVLPVCRRGRRRPVRREAEPARGRDRARPSLRHDRRPDHVHAAERPRHARRHDRPRDDVRRRGPGHGHGRGTPELSDDRPDLALLERIAREVAAEWGVELGEPYALARYSFVAPAGDGAVLKVTPPEDDESDEEAEALELWAGDGAVRLLRRDRARRALLIERAGGDISGLPDEEATRIGVAIGLKLWREAAEPFRWIGDHVPRWLDNAGGNELAAAGARPLRVARRRSRDARARRLPPPQHPLVERAERSRSTRSRCSASRSTTYRRFSGIRSGIG